MGYKNRIPQVYLDDKLDIIDKQIEAEKEAYGKPMAAEKEACEKQIEAFQNRLAKLTVAHANKCRICGFSLVQPLTMTWRPRAARRLGSSACNQWDAKS